MSNIAKTLIKCVETIGHNAFDGCTSLREIHFKTVDIEQCAIDDNAFDGIEP